MLRHQLAVIRRQTRRPQLTTTESSSPGCSEPVAAAIALPIVSGHADDAAALAPTPRPRTWTYGGPSGRPPIGGEIRGLVLRLARENPRWGYQRIVGEQNGIGVAVSATTVKKILREAAWGLKTLSWSVRASAGGANA